MKIGGAFSSRNIPFSEIMTQL